MVGLGKGRGLDFGFAAILSVVGAVIGWLLGAAGGALGVYLRGASKDGQDADLPEARQVH